LTAARARLDTVRKGPDQLALDAANAAVDNARTTLQNATDRYNALQSGPTDDQVAAASNAVDTARSALATAQARLDELNSHPTPAELRDAEDKVAAARAALDRMRAGAGAAPADSGAGTDVLLLQKQVEQDRAQVTGLEQDIAAGRLVAPQAGIVSSVLVRPGDPMNRDQPVIMLAKPGTPIIRADLGDKDAARVQPGQNATIQLDGVQDPVSASVVAVGNAQNGAGRVALLQPTWPGDPVPLGTAARVAVTVQEKQDVLLVPQKAVRSTGTRNYVQYMDGLIRRNANVEVGVSSGDMVEIVSGLTEGQLVVVAP
jgi:membrane fusion protein (multidrug efflux system)